MMTENEKKIVRIFVKLVPTLSEIDKEKLISFGEGIAFAYNKQEEKKATQT